MPTYVYKAVTKKGQIVRNRVESLSKQNLIRTLKNNNLIPIDIEQLSYRTKSTPRKQKRNITNIQEIMKNVNTTQIGIDNRRLSTKERINLYIARSEKSHKEILLYLHKISIY